MRRFVAIAAVMAALGISGALAQGTTKSTSPAAGSSSAGSDSRIFNAPVGHRQPRADEVPSAQENAYKESAEDKALDRKIKSICRGC